MQQNPYWSTSVADWKLLWDGGGPCTRPTTRRQNGNFNAEQWERKSDELFIVLLSINQNLRKTLKFLRINIKIIEIFNFEYYVGSLGMTHMSFVLAFIQHPRVNNPFKKCIYKNHAEVINSFYMKNKHIFVVFKKLSLYFIGITNPTKILTYLWLIWMANSFHSVYIMPRNKFVKILVMGM